MSFDAHDPPRPGARAAHPASQLRWLHTAQARSEHLEDRARLALELLGKLATEADGLLLRSAQLRAHAAGAPAAPQELETVHARLLDATRELARVAALAHESVEHDGISEQRGPRPLHAMATFAEALGHLADACATDAGRAGVRLRLSVAPALTDAPAGPIATVALHAVRRAITALACEARGGEVDVELRPEATPAHELLQSTGVPRAWCVLEVRDTREADPDEQAGAASSGLALCHDILAGLGGTLEVLSARAALGPSAPAGQLLRARFPMLPTTRRPDVEHP